MLDFMPGVEFVTKAEEEDSRISEFRRLLESYESSFQSRGKWQAEILRSCGVKIETTRLGGSSKAQVPEPDPHHSHPPPPKAFNILCKPWKPRFHTLYVDEAGTVRDSLEEA